MSAGAASPREILIATIADLLTGVRMVAVGASSPIPAAGAMLLRARNVGLSPWEVVAAYAVYNVIYSLGSYPAGALSDKLGRWLVIGVGWAIYAAVYAGFAVANSSTILPLFAVYGLYMALTDGVGKALIADHAPKDQRGRALGIFNLATGITTILSSVVAGVLWDRIDPSMPFWVGAAAAALAVMILPLASRSTRRGAV